MNGENIIEIKNIKKNFGEVKALNGVDLVVEKGSVLGLLGPNGAGKTTLVRVLTTLINPDEGEVIIDGLNLRTDSGDIRNIIGLAGQYAAVDEILTGRENLVMVGNLYHLPKDVIKKRAEELLERFRLTDAANRRVKTYSGGMRRRLDLAASLIGEPKILFLDEPTTGLDPRSRMELWEVIKELVEDGTTLLLTTQYLEEADFLADRIAVIDRGMIIEQGTPSELKKKIGDDVLEITFETEESFKKASETIKNMNIDNPVYIDETNTIIVSVKSNPKNLIDVLKKIDDTGVQIKDIILRKPSLDDVFLKLTEGK